MSCCFIVFLSLALNELLPENALKVQYHVVLSPVACLTAERQAMKVCAGLWWPVNVSRWKPQMIDLPFCQKLQCPCALSPQADLPRKRNICLILNTSKSCWQPRNTGSPEYLVQQCLNIQRHFQHQNFLALIMQAACGLTAIWQKMNCSEALVNCAYQRLTSLHIGMHSGLKIWFGNIYI